MSLGTRIKQYRLGAGLMQEELAEKLLLRRQTISRWETDKAEPTISDLIHMAFIFHTSLEDLLRDEIMDFKDQQAQVIKKKMLEQQKAQENTTKVIRRAR